MVSLLVRTLSNYSYRDILRRIRAVPFTLAGRLGLCASGFKLTLGSAGGLERSGFMFGSAPALEVWGEVSWGLQYVT